MVQNEKKFALLRSLMRQAGVRPCDLVKRWGVKSPTVTAILNGRSRSHFRELDLAELLSEALKRKITWERVFDPPHYIRRRDLLPTPNTGKVELNG